jgi:hypothetical protein
MWGCRMSKALGDTARVEWVQAIFLKMQMWIGHRIFYPG